MINITVQALEVAKSYLVAELSKIFLGDDLQKELKENVNRFSENEVWRLLEALSFTYRLNGVFSSISDDSFVWSKEEIDCNKLLLTGMNPQIDIVTHSEVINNNPLKFHNYLVKYFQEHPSDDPKGLGQFRPKGVKIKYPTILLIEKEGKFHLLDGSNRLMAQLFMGNEIITAYVGRKVKNGKMRLGDSIFLLLRQVYVRSDKATKQAIKIIMKELVKMSSDGKNAVKTYWVDHAREEELKGAGNLILSEASKNL